MRPTRIEIAAVFKCLAVENVGTDSMRREDYFKNAYIIWAFLPMHNQPYYYFWPTVTSEVLVLKLKYKHLGYAARCVLTEFQLKTISAISFQRAPEIDFVLTTTKSSRIRLESWRSA